MFKKFDENLTKILENLQNSTKILSNFPKTYDAFPILT